MEITQDDKENTILCKDDCDDWCTVKKKRQSKRRARFKKKMESVLEAIIEDVSEEELYFSSEEEIQQKPVQEQKNLVLVLKPQQYNNIRNEFLNKNTDLKKALKAFSNRNKESQSHPRSTQSSILDKLHQTLDKVSTDLA